MTKLRVAVLAALTIAAASFFIFEFITDSEKDADPAGSSTDGITIPNPDLDAPVFTPRPVVTVPLSGRVTEGSGVPRPAVEVECLRQVGTIGGGQFEVHDTRTTNPQGEFEFPEVPIGPYRIRATETGFSQVQKSLILAAGSPPPFVELVLVRGLSISGSIESEEGAPLSGVEVVAFRESGNEDDSIRERLLWLMRIEEVRADPGIRAISAEDGSYQISGLSPGPYRIRATTAGHGTRTSRYVVAGSTNVDFELSAGGTLAGTITSLLGTPIEGAIVSLRRAHDGPDILEKLHELVLPPLAATETGRDGSFTFDIVGEETPYSLIVEAAGYQPHQAGPFSVENYSRIDESIQLEQGHLIFGTVRAPGGELLPDAICVALGPRVGELEAAMGTGSIQVKSGERGDFAFDTLPDAPHSLHVHHPEYASFSRTEVLPSREPMIATLSVGARIQGRVIDPVSEAGIPGAQVMTLDPGAHERTVITNDEGEFELRGATVTKRGLITLSARREGYESLSKSEIRVVEGETTTGVDFSLRRNGSMQGLVLDHFDQPVEGATLVVERPNSSNGGLATIAFTRSGADGSFSIPEVTPGEGTVLRADHKSFVESVSPPFAIEPGQAVEDFTIQLKVGGEIRGRVLDANDVPIPGALIGVRDGGMHITDPMLLAQNMVTNEAGEFVFNALPAGDHALLASANGFLNTEVSGVRVHLAQATTDVVVRMSAGEKISGFVRDTSGKAIGGATVTAIDTSFGLRKFTKETGSDGSFEFDKLGPYPVDLEASARGHGKLRLTEQVVNQSGIVMVLESFGGLRGRVLGVDGEPLESFNVSPRRFNAAGRALPNVPSRTFKGETFDFGGLIPGTYEVIIGSRNHASFVHEQVVINPSRFTILPLSSLDSGGKIAGVVYEKETGFGLPDARITVIGGEENFHHDGTTGPSTTIGRGRVPVSPEGEFEIAGLFYDEATLRVEHSGFVTMLFDVRVGTTDLILAMVPGGAIDGKIIVGNELGSSARVRLTSARDAQEWTTISDGKGHFQFRGLEPGNYNLVATRTLDTKGDGNPKIAPVSVSVVAGETIEVEIHSD